MVTLVWFSHSQYHIHKANILFYTLFLLFYMSALLSSFRLTRHISRKSPETFFEKTNWSSSWRWLKWRIATPTGWCINQFRRLWESVSPRIYELSSWSVVQMKDRQHLFRLRDGVSMIVKKIDFFPSYFKPTSWNMIFYITLQTLESTLWQIKNSENTEWRIHSLAKSWIVEFTWSCVY